MKELDRKKVLEEYVKFYLHEIYEPPKKDKFYERIKNRNTIIIVK